jgi:integrase/recombinase XerD
MNALGTLVVAFFEDHLKVQKGLRPTSIHSYRDVLKLFLNQLAARRHCPITRLELADLTAEAVLAFLQSLEVTRGNQIRTRNQRLAALRTFFRYLASRAPELLAEAARVEEIPTKRTPPPTCYLERDEIQQVLAGIATRAPLGQRDHAILTVMYNTGARVQEIADLHVGDVDLNGPYRVRLHGKGDKWRACPLWPETAQELQQLDTVGTGDPATPLFRSRLGRPMTRFGLYKVVKRHTAQLADQRSDNGAVRRLSPHVVRHSTAVHLLEAGVDVNVIRAWLGHVSLETTNRYAEVNIRMKEAAMALCVPPQAESPASPRNSVWHREPDLLKWLESL